MEGQKSNNKHTPESTSIPYVNLNIDPVQYRWQTRSHNAASHCTGSMFRFTYGMFVDSGVSFTRMMYGNKLWLNRTSLISFGSKTRISRSDNCLLLKMNQTTKGKYKKLWVITSAHKHYYLIFVTFERLVNWRPKKKQKKKPPRSYEIQIWF